MTNWFKKNITLLSLALAKVEKNALTQEKKDLNEEASQEQSHKKGFLSDALLKGELNQEVKLLRYRTYKILDAASRINLKNAVFSPEGELISYTVEKKDFSHVRDKGDPYDTYKVEMIFDNVKTGAGFTETGLTPDSVKSNPLIECTREVTPKFRIEDYAKKLYIRHISNKEKLLEFHISKYLDTSDIKTTFLLSDLKKIMAKVKVKYYDLLDIKSVMFITTNTAGFEDLCAFEYDITKFDKVVEHDGHYIVKFFADVRIDGAPILDKYFMEDLETKYENKELRK